MYTNKRTTYYKFCQWKSVLKLVYRSVKALRRWVTFIIRKNDNKLYPPGSGSMWTSPLAPRPYRRRRKVRLRTMALADFATAIPNIDISAQVWSCTIERKLGDYCSALCWTVSIRVFLSISIFLLSIFYIVVYISDDGIA